MKKEVFQQQVPTATNGIIPVVQADSAQGDFHQPLALSTLLYFIFIFKKTKLLLRWGFCLFVFVFIFQLCGVNSAVTIVPFNGQDLPEIRPM